MSVAETRYAEHREQLFAPPPPLQRLVAAGLLGRKVARPSTPGSLQLHVSRGMVVDSSPTRPGTTQQHAVDWLVADSGVLAGWRAPRSANHVLSAANGASDPSHHLMSGKDNSRTCPPPRSPAFTRHDTRETVAFSRRGSFAIGDLRIARSDAAIPHMAPGFSGRHFPRIGDPGAVLVSTRTAKRLLSPAGERPLLLA
jgi:hypothetical protein